MREDPAAISAEDVVRAATIHGAQAVGMADRIGSLEVGKEADLIPFTVETISDGSLKSILSDLENAELIYTFDQTDPTLFSSKFIDALSYRVASNIAFQITGDPELAQQTFKVYQTVLRSAGGSSAQEGIDQVPRDSEWIRSRW